MRFVLGLRFVSNASQQAQPSQMDTSVTTGTRIYKSYGFTIFTTPLITSGTPKSPKKNLGLLGSEIETVCSSKVGHYTRNRRLTGVISPRLHVIKNDQPPHGELLIPYSFGSSTVNRFTSWAGLAEQRRLSLARRWPTSKFPVINSPRRVFKN